jgi:archaetidylinositol phosphate synthase
MSSSSAAVPVTTGFQDATRIQGSILAPLERRTLHWLAVRLPAWVNSDHLTLLALAAMAGAGGGYWLSSVTPTGLLLVVLCLAVNWFGDSLDGTVARLRQQQRPRYGYYVDHVVDAFGTLFLFSGLALSGWMSPLVATSLLVAYFAVCLETYLAAHSLGDFEMSFLGLGPTELRILLAIGNVALFIYSGHPGNSGHPTTNLFGRTLNAFDTGGVAGAAGLLVTFVCLAIRHTRALYRMEPRPAGVRATEPQR